MTSFPAQEIKRRGIRAVDEALTEGPVRIVRNNRPTYVVLSENDYEDMLHDLSEARLASSEADIKARRIMKGSSATLMGELGKVLRMADKPAFKLAWTATFKDTAIKFLKKHPDLTGIFEGTLKRLETNPHDPKLRLHPLHGRHKGKTAVRLTYEYRIVIILIISEKEITLLDIGSHDEVYR